jgi:2-methylcitrate dehydratase
MDKTEKQLVDFAHGIAYSDLPKAMLRATRGRMIDSMGCAMAALLAPPVRALRRVAMPVADADGAGGGARLFGTLTRTTPDMAALVNGTTVRYLDMSDAHLMKSSAHPSDNIPGLMAIAEITGAGGKDLMLAIAISYEVQCVFCEVVPSHGKGWDQPLAGAPAAALAAGRLLGLDKARLRHALALSIVPNFATMQTRHGELSMWKGVAGPNAARQGVFAALLAQAGMTGPTESYEGRYGLWRQSMGRSYDFAIPRKLDKHEFALIRTNIKIYPVRDAIQVPITAALKLRDKLKVEDIEAIRIDTYVSHFGEQVKDTALWAPTTRETADHSLPFCVAAALLDGKVTPETFAQERFLDDDARAMVKRITVAFDDAFEKVAPTTRRCRITATLKNGKTVTAEHCQTPADIRRGPSDAEFEAKFHTLAGRTMESDARHKMLDMLWRLDKLQDINGIIELTAI